ncbi:hypothetical protein [Arthrobacter sp. USHLN218]|uniref:hypothetical protein n=1 Tax=Arthrobacter sp. USHLN218 TaxID=3081232 RepID=UPI003016913A
MPTFDPIFAKDPGNPNNIAQNATITIFDPADPAGTPITLTSVDGQVLPNPIRVDGRGMGPAFQHETLYRVGWEGGGLTNYFTSYEAMHSEAVAARSAAEGAAMTAQEAAEVAGAEAAAAATAGVDAVLSGAKADVDAAAAAVAASAQAAADAAALVDAPADLAIEAAIKGANSKTAAALNATTAQVRNAFGAAAGIDTTGATDATAKLQAIVDGAGTGDVIVLKGRYLCNSAVVVPGSKSLTIDASAATLVRGGSDPSLFFKGNFDAQQSVASVDGAKTVLTLTGDAVGLAPLDIVKVISDDPIPDGRAGNGAIAPRLGEFAQVKTVSGATVTLTGPLREAYATNIRVARLQPGTARLIAPTFDISAGVASAGTRGEGVIFESLTSPVIDRPRVLRNVGPAFQFRSCNGYVVLHPEVLQALSNSGTNALGYGVHDSSSNYGIIFGGTFRNSVDVYTDGTGQVDPGSVQTRSYGRTFNTKLIGVRAVNVTGVGFSTHHDSEGVEFIGCTAQMPADRPGFSLRGRGHAVKSCTVYGGNVGVELFTETTNTAPGETRRIHVTDLTTRGTKTVASVFIRKGTHPNLDQRDTETSLVLEGVDATGAEKFVYAVNGTVVARNSTVEFAATTPQSPVELSNAWLTLENVTLDFSKVTSTTSTQQRVLYSVGKDATQRSRFTVDGLRILSNAYFSGRLGSGPIVTDAFTDVQARRIVTDRALNKMPGTIAELPGNVVQWTAEASGAAPYASSNSMDYANAALEGSLHELFRSPDPQLFLMVTINDGAPKTLGVLPPGKFNGQRLTIYTASVGGQTLTVKHGPTYGTNFPGFTDIVLGTDTQLNLVWIGSRWRKVT